MVSVARGCQSKEECAIPKHHCHGYVRIYAHCKQLWGKELHYDQAARGLMRGSGLAASGGISGQGASDDLCSLRTASEAGKKVFPPGGAVQIFIWKLICFPDRFSSTITWILRPISRPELAETMWTTQ